MAQKKIFLRQLHNSEFRIFLKLALTVGIGSSLEIPWSTAEEVMTGRLSSSGITEVMV